MRLLHFADVHLDAPFARASKKAGRRRRTALRDALVRIVELADEQSVDAILCAGDLYEHDRFTPDTLAFVGRVLSEAGRPVFLAPGNHDWYGSRSLYAEVRWPEHIHVFREDQLVPVELADGLTLWGAGFCGPTRDEGFLCDGFHVDRAGIHLALFHGSERKWLPLEVEGKQAYGPFSADEVERAGLAHAFVGHLHTPRDHERFTYPGNPEPLGFGEQGERGVIIAEVRPDGQIMRSRHVVARYEVHEIDLDVTELNDSQQIRDAVTARLNGKRGAARLTLTGELAPAVELRLDDLSNVEHALDDLQIRARDLRPGYDIEAIAAEPTVRGEFVRSVVDSDQFDGDEARRRILVTGLRALDGRDDLEVL